MRPFFNQLPKDKAIRGVEVGVHSGDNVLDVFKELNNIFFYLVDPYVSYIDPDREVSQEEMDGIEALAHQKVGGPNVKWVKKYSVDASKEFKNGELDFVYIDGNHATDFVRTDIKAWLPRVKKGGLLGGHDYAKPEVTEAVDEGIKGKKLIVELPDWWYRI